MVCKKGLPLGAGEVAQQLRSRAALPEVPSVASRIHVVWLTTTCYSGSKDLMPLASWGICTHVHITNHTRALTQLGTQW